MRRAQYLAILVAFIFSRESVGAREFPSFGATAYRELLRTAFSQLERFAGLVTNSKFGFLADGGGDGGGSDGGGSSSGGGSAGGGSSSGGSSDGGGSDGAGAAGAAGASASGASDGGDGAGSSSDGVGGATSSDGDGGASPSNGDGGAGSSDGNGDSSSASDAASAASSAASDAASSAASDAASDMAANAADATTTTTVSSANDNASDPDAAPPSVAVTETADPTDPTNVNNAVSPELAAIEDQATTDPRGGFTPTDFPGSGLPFVTTVSPGGFRPPGGPPENVEIHAVIVSAAQSPWDAIRRAPGVATVTVVGGIVALGKAPIPGEIPGGGPQPDWLRLIPDLRLLNGSMVPPVVPNIMDIRWLNCPIQVKEPLNSTEEPKS